MFILCLFYIIKIITLLSLLLDKIKKDKLLGVCASVRPNVRPYVHQSINPSIYPSINPIS